MVCLYHTVQAGWLRGHTGLSIKLDLDRNTTKMGFCFSQFSAAAIKDLIQSLIQKPELQLWANKMKALIKPYWGLSGKSLLQVKRQLQFNYSHNASVVVWCSSHRAALSLRDSHLSFKKCHAHLRRRQGKNNQWLHVIKWEPTWVYRHGLQKDIMGQWEDHTYRHTKGQFLLLLFFYMDM